MDEFPANSKTSKAPTEGKPKQKALPKADVKEKVITGEAIQRKKPLGRRFKDVFLGADIKGASSYIVADVLFPAVRNMVVDATTKGIERFVYGETGGRRPPGPGRPRTTYHSPVERSRGRGVMLPDQPPHYGRPTRRPDRPSGNEIVLGSRNEAELVLESLRDVIDKYEVATVSDFHQLVGLPASYVDEKWGWTNLSHVDVQQIREGYLINMPSPEPV